MKKPLADGFRFSDASQKRRMLRRFCEASLNCPRLKIARTLHPLDDGSDALPTADAHRHQGTPPPGSLQLVERLDRQDAAGRSDRVAERDAAAVGIRAIRRQFQ